MEQKWEKIKQVWIQIREDNRAAIVFERENGEQFALMVPPTDLLDPEEPTGLHLKEI